jgi:hypothetical protein
VPILAVISATWRSVVMVLGDEPATPPATPPAATEAPDQAGTAVLVPKPAD